MQRGTTNGTEYGPLRLPPRFSDDDPIRATSQGRVFDSCARLNQLPKLDADAELSLKIFAPGTSIVAALFGNHHHLSSTLPTPGSSNHDVKKIIFAYFQR